jgi:hypothetical protein
VKLLRRVDHNRWIAELDDRIGFVEEEIIVHRVRCLGVTSKKDDAKVGR